MRAWMGLSAQTQAVDARTRAVGARQHRTLTPTLTLPPCQPHPQANYGKEDAAAVAAVKGVYRDLELEAVFRRQGVERVEAWGFVSQGLNVEANAECCVGRDGAAQARPRAVE